MFISAKQCAAHAMHYVKFSTKITTNHYKLPPSFCTVRAVQTIRPHTLNEHIPIHNMHPKQSARAGLVHLKHNA